MRLPKHSNLAIHVGSSPIAVQRRCTAHSSFCSSMAPASRTMAGKGSLEGVVSKRRDSAYRSGKQTSWIKVKCQPWREANRNRHTLFQVSIGDPMHACVGSLWPGNRRRHLVRR